MSVHGSEVPKRLKSSPSQHKPSSMDLFAEFGLIHNPDGTFTRFKREATTTTEAHNSSLPGQTVFTKDIPLNTTHNTWLRLYRPIAPPHGDNTKLPLILYIHGGAFVVCSPSDTDIHIPCTAMAAELPVVILSLEYRLAPESRLPAAYEDAVEALAWIQSQALSGNDDLNQVDFTKVYVMGSSAGGNIAYHASMRALLSNLEPLVIRGYIFDHPFFSSEERTESEIRLADDPNLPLASCDAAWELSLPEGCNRDHEYSNPLIAEGIYKDKIRMLGRCFVNTRGGDLLVDFHMNFASMLEENGVRVTTRYKEEGAHCMDFEQLGEGGKALFAALKQFISDASK